MVLDHSIRTDDDDDDNDDDDDVWEFHISFNSI